MKKRYSLRKCRKILHTVLHRSEKRKSDLTLDQKTLLQEKLESLQENIRTKNKKESSDLAKELEQSCQAWIPKTFFEKIVNFSVLIVVLTFALCIRQMWFELYTIPTGSMRPTLKESDNLFVIKDPYGINTPTKTGHLRFEEDKLKRGNIVVLSAQDLDAQNPDTMYFYIIPGKKQFVKRLIGKPGDTLYFYGGKIYGIDRNNRPIEAFADTYFENLEHIPFINLEGKVKTGSKAVSEGVFPESTFYQMNIPISKLSMSSYGQTSGKMLGSYKSVEDYYKLWGIENYGVARIVSQKQLNEFTSHYDTSSDYYLQIFHHPSIKNSELKRDFYHRYRPSLKTQSSFIPLSKDHLDTIFENLTTARFIIKDGYLSRYGTDFNSYKNAGYLPKIPLQKELQPENGTYEFQDGVAYKVHMRGYLTKLKKDHPIYNKDANYIQLMYNLGYEFVNHFSPNSKATTFLPSRYVYFRDGDLYGMNHPIISKNDQTLTNFIENEMGANTPFIPLKPPFMNEDGSYNISFFEKYGMKLPEKMYLTLGDNHAMSGDSRDYGFVPEKNLRGGASFIFSPPSARWGFLPQPPWETLVFSRILFWSLGSIFLVCYVVHRVRKRKLKIDLLDLAAGSTDLIIQ